MTSEDEIYQIWSQSASTAANVSIYKLYEQQQQ